MARDLDMTDPDQLDLYKILKSIDLLEGFRMMCPMNKTIPRLSAMVKRSHTRAGTCSLTTGSRSEFDNDLPKVKPTKHSDSQESIANFCKYGKHRSLSYDTNFITHEG